MIETDLRKTVEGPICWRGVRVNSVIVTKETKKPSVTTPSPDVRDVDNNAVPVRSTSGDIADFVKTVKAMQPKRDALGLGEWEATGRLVFGMDATMSRQPTWDLALSLQGEMFEAVAEVGGLDVQLVYFRGFGECKASKWVRDPMSLARLMSSVSCRGGRTQIEKVLSHTRKETRDKPVNALVYVGDCMEERVDDLCHVAGELGMLNVPVFAFQEGYDATAENAFKEIARLSKGAYCRFDAGSAAQLRDLLTAVAVYAAGGRKALKQLEGQQGRSAQILLEQLR